MIRMFWSPPVEPGTPSKACEMVMPPNRLRLPAQAIPVITRITTATNAVSNCAQIASRRFTDPFGRRWRGDCGEVAQDVVPGWS